MTSWATTINGKLNEESRKETTIALLNKYACLLPLSVILVRSWRGMAERTPTLHSACDLNILYVSGLALLLITYRSSPFWSGGHYAYCSWLDLHIAPQTFWRCRIGCPMSASHPPPRCALEYLCFCKSAAGLSLFAPSSCSSRAFLFPFPSCVFLFCYVYIYTTVER